MTASSLDRRELLKVSLLGAAVLALPFVRVVRATTVSRIPSSALPRPFTVGFSTPPVLAPVRSDATTDYYQLTQRQQTVEIIPGFRTPVFAYNGTVPGPTIVVPQGRATVVRQINLLPPTTPPWATPRGPRRTCTGRCRARSTTATPTTPP